MDVSGTLAPPSQAIEAQNQPLSAPSSLIPAENDGTLQSPSSMIGKSDGTLAAPSQAFPLTSSQPWKEAASSPTLSATDNPTANVAKTALDWAGEAVRRATEEPITATMRAAQEGENPLRAIGQGLMGERVDTFPDVISHTPGYEPGKTGVSPELQQKMNDIVGTVGSFTNPVMLGAGMGDLTDVGRAAEKTGDLGGNLMEQFQRGQRAPLTIGGYPLITGETFAKGLQQAKKIPGVQEGLDAMKGFQKFSGHTGMDKIARQYETDLNATNRQIADRSQEERRFMRDTAESNKEQLGLPKTASYEDAHAALNKTLLDWLESEEKPQNLPEAAKAYGEELRGRMGQVVAKEKSIGAAKYSPLSDYQYHVPTDEFEKFFNKTYPKAGGSQQFLKNVTNVNKERGVRQTINDVNAMAQAGKLDKVEGMGGLKELSNFKGKVFNDDVVDLNAARELKSAKVQNEYGFVQKVADSYGMSDKAAQDMFRSNPGSRGDWVEVSHPGLRGEKTWFPKEIGDYLSNMQKVNSKPGIFKKFLQTTNELVKKTNFGVWPASATKIEVGNQLLAAYGGIWNPHSQLMGHELASAIRDNVNNLDNTRPIVFSPKLGPLTQKQVYDLAVKNRGVGMGLFRNELSTFLPGHQNPGFLGKGGKVSKVVNAVPNAGWALHNYIEDGTRMGSFIEALRQGYTPEAAGRKVMQSLYDYSDVGATDNTLRRYVPFYIFMRKNVPNFVGKYLEKPGMMNLPEKVRTIVNRQDQKSQQEQKYYSPWMRESRPWILGNDKEGNEYRLLADRLDPRSDMNEWFGSGKTFGDFLKNTASTMQPVKTVLGTMNPLLKTFLMELPFNQSLYFGDKIERMPGEKSAIGPWNVPTDAAYALKNNIRPVQEFNRTTSDTIPGWLRALRLFPGLNIQAVNPIQERLDYLRRLSQSIKGVGGQGGMNDVKYYENLMKFHLSRGNKRAAELDRVNLQQALQNVRNAAAELGGK